MSVRDQWLKVRPVIVTGRQNKTLLIPAFSANCGPPKGSIVNNPLSVATACPLTTTNALLNITTNLTVEFSFKDISELAGNGYLFELGNGQTISGLNLRIARIFSTNKIRVYYKDSTNVNHTFDSDASSIAKGKWNHLAVTYDSAAVAGGQFKVYINGNLVNTATGVNAPLFTASIWIVSVAGQTTGLRDNVHQIYVDELRIWNVTRTLDQIRFAHNHAVSSLTAVNAGIVAYWKFNETSGTTSIDIVNSIALTWVSGTSNLVQTEGAPLFYGASFIAARYSVSLSGPSSLRFPVIPADDPNHCLCVSYLDEDNTTTIRKKLYSASEDYGTEDIAPNPPFYQGEVLPANYYLEFWNIDGLPTVNLTADLTLKTSHTTYPNFGTDHAVSADATPVGTTALAAAYPISFPLTFSSQQVYP